MKIDIKIFPMSTHGPSTTSGVESYDQINLVLLRCPNVHFECLVWSSCCLHQHPLDGYLDDLAPS